MPLNSLKCQAKSVNNLYKCSYHVQKSVVSVLSQEIPKWFPNVLRTFNVFIYFLSGFSFVNIYDSKDSQGRGSLFL